VSFNVLFINQEFSIKINKGKLKQYSSKFENSINHDYLKESFKKKCT